MQAVSQPFAMPDIRRQQLIRFLVGLNIVAYAAALLSTNWDVAEHAKGAVDAFWYPPHFGIYFSLLVAALVSAAGFLIVLQAPGALTDKLRHYLALVTLTIANIIGFTGAPFDAWWHQTYGIDLTTWSPPHIHLIIGSTLVMVSCSVYFLDQRPVEASLARLGRLGRSQLLLVATLTMALLLGAVVLLDYENLPAAQALTQGSFSQSLAEIMARPRWSYPVVMSAFVLFMLALFTASTRLVGIATLTASLYTLVRLALVGISQTVHDYVGVPFYPILIPALAFDLVLALALARGLERRTMLAAAAAAAVAALALTATAPLFWSLLPVMPELNVAPWAAYWPATIITGVLAGLAGWWAGVGLRRLRP